MINNYKSDFRYKYDGGSLSSNSPTYVTRQADFDLYHALLNQEYCHIFNARQMGKSSLRKRIKAQLNEQNFACCTIDMSTICGKEVSKENFYQDLFHNLKVNLKIDPTEANYLAWEQNRESFSLERQFIELIEKVILVQIRSPIVIFFDEIDSLLTLSFEKDKWLQLIRSFYDRRYHNKDQKLTRLSFVFIGVVSTSDLIINADSTLFNISKSIEITDFKLRECQPLERGLTDFVEDTHTVMKEILKWTGGQPFLTQKICWLITKNAPIKKGSESVKIRQIILNDILTNWESTDSPEHLKTIRDRLLWQFRYPFTGSQKMNTWHQILRKKDDYNFPPPSTQILSWYLLILKRSYIIYSECNRAQKYLLRSGLVRCQNNRLVIKNEIYRAVFTEAWAKHQLKAINSGNHLRRWVLLGVGGLGLLSVFGLQCLPIEEAFPPMPEENQDQRFKNSPLNPHITDHNL